MKSNLDNSKLSGNKLNITNLNKGFDKMNININGNVKIQLDDNFTLYCEDFRNKLNSKGEKLIIFTKNCRIESDKNVSIKSNYFEYNLNKNLLFIKGNVVCKSNGITLKTSQCHYNVRKKCLTIDSKCTIIKDNIKIESNKGDLYIENSNFTLYDDVILNQNNEFKLKCNYLNFISSYISCRPGNKEKNKYIEIETKGVKLLTEKSIDINISSSIVSLEDVLLTSTDYLCFGKNVEYDKNRSTINVKNGVEMLTKNNIRLISDGLFYNDFEKEGKLIGDSLIEVIGNTINDNIYVIADDFTYKLVNPTDEVCNIDKLDKFDITQFKNSEILNTSEVKNENGVNNVTFNDRLRYNGRNSGLVLQGTPFILNAKGNVEIFSETFKCKSDSFEFKNNNIVFNNKIIIWQDSNRLTAGCANIFLENGIRKIILRDNPFVALFKNAYPNQIKCETIYIGFKNNRIDKILFDENVETLLFIYDDNDNNNVLKYINNMKTSQICVLFDEKSNPQKVLFNSNDGKIIPRKYVDDNVLFMDRYKNFDVSQPEFENFLKRKRKTNLITDDIKEKFLLKK